MNFPWKLKETPKRVSIIDSKGNVVAMLTTSKNVDREQMMKNAYLILDSVRMYESDRSDPFRDK